MYSLRCMLVAAAMTCGGLLASAIAQTRPARTAMVVAPLPLPTAVVRLRVQVRPSPGMTRTVQNGMCGELTRIWARYAIRITCGLSTAIDAPDASLRVYVFDEHLSLGSAGRREHAIAAIVFSGSQPTPVVLASMRAASDLARNAPEVRAGSPGLRESLTSLVLGRVLAHEVGHFLFESPDHVGEGLMRPQFDRWDAVTSRRERLDIEPALVARLARRWPAVAAAAAGGVK
ncbi:MAG TPA: hypothetical protein VMO26_10460 [Vicinamibacterales bacterium]|nr:hypothetical protein [Vicinamibacterales bacterium]